MARSTWNTNRRARRLRPQRPEPGRLDVRSRPCVASLRRRGAGRAGAVRSVREAPHRLGAVRSTSGPSQDRCGVWAKARTRSFAGGAHWAGRGSAHDGAGMRCRAPVRVPRGTRWSCTKVGTGRVATMTLHAPGVGGACSTWNGRARAPVQPGARGTGWLWPRLRPRHVGAAAACVEVARSAREQHGSGSGLQMLAKKSSGGRTRPANSVAPATTSTTPCGRCRRCSGSASRT